MGGKKTVLLSENQRAEERSTQMGDASYMLSAPILTAHLLTPTPPY